MRVGRRGESLRGAGAGRGGSRSLVKVAGWEMLSLLRVEADEIAVNREELD